MVDRIISAAGSCLANPVLRGVILICYFGLAAVVAVLFPDTPDELLRIDTAERILQAGEYNLFFWPPGNVLIILANPFLGMGGLSDVALVRLVNLALAALPLLFLLNRLRDGRLLLVWLFAAPYSFLVLSTGSQQGLMIGLFALIAMAISTGRLWLLLCSALLLFLVNPAMILVLPFTLLCLALLRDRWFWKAFATACLAYLPILGTALLIWVQGGDLMPTLANNGPINIFLGNNADPMSHRGVGDLTAALERYNIPDGSAVDAALAYLRTDVTGFVTNLLRKLVLYWMPWDFLRSGMGQGVSTVIFIYIGLAQIAIYGTLWAYRRTIDLRLLAFALMFAVAAWALYTLFFVKIRFRVPFDILLLTSCLIAATFGRPAATER